MKKKGTIFYYQDLQLQTPLIEACASEARHTRKYSKEI